MASMRYTESLTPFRRDLATKSLRTPTKSSATTVTRSPSDCGKKSSAPSVLLGPPRTCYESLGRTAKFYGGPEPQEGTGDDHRLDGLVTVGGPNWTQAAQDRGRRSMEDAFIQEWSLKDRKSSVSAHSKSQSLPAAAANGVVYGVMSVAPEDLASQLTLLDLPVFRAISPEELTSCGWSKRNKRVVAPNVVAFTRRFNQVSFWTVKEILEGREPKARGEVLAHFVRVAKKLYELNNLHSLFAIISALQSASIYRLTKTWAQLTKKERQTFEKLSEVFQDTNNWQKLRQHMDSLKLPCIPYLGLFLTDLVYIDMAHPQSPGIESEPRRTKMNNILRVISSLQESEYSSLHLLPHIKHYLQSAHYIEELQKFVEDEQYKKSLQLEPPSPTSSNWNTKESMANAGSTVASLNLSPAKGLGGCSVRFHSALSNGNNFAPGHRKSRSLGTKSRSTSLPRNMYNHHGRSGGPLGIFNKCVQVTPSDETAPSTPRHLLDDSLLEEQYTLKLGEISPSGSKLSHIDDVNDGHTLISRRGSLLSADSEDFPAEPLQCLLQGCLRRKTVQKGGRKPPVAAWQRYWVQIWGSSMVYYAPRGFKGNDRSDFKREPCKVVSLLGQSVALLETGSPPDLFQLADPIRGNVYKFRCGNETTTKQWHHLLYQISSGIEDKPPPANLMTFE